MKTVASVFSWLGGIFWTIFTIVYLSLGMTVQKIIQVGSHQFVEESKVSYSWWVWLIGVGTIILRFVVLKFRQDQAEQGDKIGCGLATMFCASFLGGIFTLLIPTTTEETVESIDNKLNALIETSPANKKKYSQAEADELIKNMENICKKGFMSEEEFNKKVAEIKLNIIK